LQTVKDRGSKTKEVKYSYNLEEYFQCFYAFLNARKLNRSEERGAILRAVFGFDKRFSVSTLHKKLEEQKHYISRSTLHCTLELLIEAGLVLKHYLPTQITPLYEKCYGSDTHNHICIEGTEEIIEFYDGRIDEIKKDIAEKYAVEVINQTFTLYCKKKK